MLKEWGVGSGSLRVVLGLLAGNSLSAQQIPPLPDSSGWGVHVLALARAPDSAIWVGSYGQGIFVLRPHATAWEHITTSDDTAKHAISWDFVHAFAFGPRGEVWYGTVGNGWGLSRDGGKTWQNWEYRELGPEWQYVAPNGMVTRGDTTYIATADGIKVTWDDGAHWAVITDSIGAATSKDTVIGRIRNQYVLAIALAEGSNLWISELTGIAHSPDGGRTWHERFTTPPCNECVNRARALLVDSKNRFWVGTEAGVYRFGAEFGGWNLGNVRCLITYQSSDRANPADCPSRWPAVQSIVQLDSQYVVAAHGGGVGVLSPGAEGMAYWCGGPPANLQTSALGMGRRILEGGMMGVRSDDIQGPRLGCSDDNYHPGAAVELKHTWFRRPIDLADQPYIDQTYRFGSTMGGNFQAHQGVEFNNPGGTPVHAIGDGVVVYSGPAEAGANTVAIRHDRKLDGQYLFSVYYHNSKLLVKVGDRVKAGDVISLVGNTGRATNDHLHLEVHVAPTTDSSKIVDAAVRYPPFNANPELWIEPLSGTGVVAGQVWDSKGNPVQQTRIYGLVKPEPQETPFSYIETYGPKNHEDPAYHEHFAIGDVPAGEYVMSVEIEGKKVSRTVKVDPGKLTWVEFRPDAH